jgi:hypothetical protein
VKKASTSISPALRAYIYERDEGRCQRCGRPCLDSEHSIQHRRPRQMGGDRNANRPANLVLMCGSATTGCHAWAEFGNRTAAYQKGWLVHRWEDPAATPILRFDRTWFLLGAEWTRLYAPDNEEVL